MAKLWIVYWTGESVLPKIIKLERKPEVLLNRGMNCDVVAMPTSQFILKISNPKPEALSQRF